MSITEYLIYTLPIGIFESKILNVRFKIYHTQSKLDEQIRNLLCTESIWFLYDFMVLSGSIKERGKPIREQRREHTNKNFGIVFGLFKFGSSILEMIKKSNFKLVRLSILKTI